jgi:hypothetical protein
MCLQDRLHIALLEVVEPQTSRLHIGEVDSQVDAHKTDALGGHGQVRGSPV